MLLSQKQKEIAKEVIECNTTCPLFITDFSLDSIGVFLDRQDKLNEFTAFVDDMVINTGLRILRLSGEGLLRIESIVAEYHLDFDDAYQYAVATRHELEIVSFDSDFDDTDIGRLHPGEVVERLGG